MSKRLYAVIGLGRFGSAVASTLVSLGQDVIGLDDNEDRVREIGELTTNALQIDATDIRALRQAGVNEADVAVISIGENIEASLLVVMQVKDLGVPQIIAKAVTPLHGRILEKLGVTRVIFPEREVAERTARSLVIPNALDYITLSKDFSIVEVTVPPLFVGHTLRSVELRARYGLTLVAIKRQVAGKEETLVSPSADEVLLEGDIVALLGSNEMLARIERVSLRNSPSSSAAVDDAGTRRRRVRPRTVPGASAPARFAPVRRRSRHPRRSRCRRRTGPAHRGTDSLVADEEVRERE